MCDKWCCSVDLVVIHVACIQCLPVVEAVPASWLCRAFHVALPELVQTYCCTVVPTTGTRWARTRMSRPAHTVARARVDMPCCRVRYVEAGLHSMVGKACFFIKIRQIRGSVPKVRLNTLKLRPQLLTCPKTPNQGRSSPVGCRTPGDGAPHLPCQTPRPVAHDLGTLPSHFAYDLEIVKA